MHLSEEAYIDPVMTEEVIKFQLPVANAISVQTGQPQSCQRRWALQANRLLSAAGSSTPPRGGQRKPRWSPGAHNHQQPRGQPKPKANGSDTSEPTASPEATIGRIS